MMGWANRLMAAAMLTLAACSSASVDDAPVPPERQLIWSDEFDGDTVDDSRWNHWITRADTDWYPHLYFAGGEKHVQVKDGVLTLRAWRDDKGRFASGQIQSDGRGFWKFGSFEVRMRTPSTPGVMSSIYMMPEESKYGPWPKSGEIDVAEILTRFPRKVHGTIHYEGVQPGGDQGGTSFDRPVSEDWHIYRFDWDETSMRWYVDGKFYHEVKTWKSPVADNPKAPFDQPFYIILALGVGGDWVGLPFPDAPMPIELQVDWVRIYKLGAPSSSQ